MATCSKLPGAVQLIRKTSLIVACRYIFWWCYIVGGWGKKHEDDLTVRKTGHLVNPWNSWTELVHFWLASLLHLHHHRHHDNDCTEEEEDDDDDDDDCPEDDDDDDDDDELLLHLRVESEVEQSPAQGCWRSFTIQRLFIQSDSFEDYIMGYLWRLYNQISLKIV